MGILRERLCYLFNKFNKWSNVFYELCIVLDVIDLVVNVIDKIFVIKEFLF